MKTRHDRAFDAAVEVLEKCSTPHGFHAAYPAYDAVWARDSGVIALGASLVGDRFRETIRASLVTLKEHQSERGQVPNAVDRFSSRVPTVDFKSIDSSIWFVIAHHVYAERFGDGSLLAEHEDAIRKALTWLSYQDAGEDHMLVQQPTTDWQDAFPHRYGHTINTQALWHRALLLTGGSEEAGLLRRSTNDEDHCRLWNGRFYLPWRWKNHNRYMEKGDWFDTLGNLLAVVWDLADAPRAESIIEFVREEGVARPYPAKSIHPPIEPGSPDWHDYFEDCDARTPHHYLNGGLWPYIGGFYVCALVKTGRLDAAEEELDLLAEENLDADFAEWRDGRTGEVVTSNRNQGWNAAMYVAAHRSLEEGRSLV